MQVSPVAVHHFSGLYGSGTGMKKAGFQGGHAVEYNKFRVATTKLNHPDVTVYGGDIRTMTLSDYPQTYYHVAFMSWPCQSYTLGAEIHKKRTGDSMYLEAFREIVLMYPEVVIIENVMGMRYFPRVMESFQDLPHYYCSELVLNASQFTMMKKNRVFLILHRQPFDFSFLLDVPARPAQKLADYLDENPVFEKIPEYVYSRYNGKYEKEGRKKQYPTIKYHPSQTDPINLPVNYADDLSTMVVEDHRFKEGIRPFTVSELKRLHGFPEEYEIIGSRTEQYKGIIDSVVVPVAEWIGRGVLRYFEEIPELIPVPKSHGHKVLKAKKEEMAAALEIIKDARQQALL